jgi:hypothetical protein
MSGCSRRSRWLGRWICRRGGGGPATPKYPTMPKPPTLSAGDSPGNPPLTVHRCATATMSVAVQTSAVPEPASAPASSQHTNTLAGPAGAVATVTLSGVASSHRFTDGTPGLGNGASVTTQWQGSAALLLAGLLAAAGLARLRRSAPPAA